VLRDGMDGAGANAHFANAQGRVHDAMSARDRAAQSAIDDIHAITKYDGLKDSWWDKWGKDLLSVITDVARINAKAGVEIAAGQAEKLTVRQVIRLKPSELADSERLLAKPVADLKPGQTVYRVHGGAPEYIIPGPFGPSKGITVLSDTPIRLR